MNAIVQYLLLASICQILFFVFYLGVLHQQIQFKWMRYSLLLIMALAILLPLHSYSIGLDSTSAMQDSPAYLSEIFQTGVSKSDDTIENTIDSGIYYSKEIHHSTGVKWQTVFLFIYMGGLFILLGRIVVSLIKILVKLHSGTIEVRGKNLLVFVSQTQSSYSFFNWIFVNKELEHSPEFAKILAHEEIHARQYHTLDILLVELLTAAMWFNPGIWYLRRTLQQVHEYLADEGALGTGINKPGYQALLLNQVAEERLIAFSSGFNPAFRRGRQSFIKKRIIMMTKPKFSQKTNLKLLAVIPLAAILFTGIACVNGQQTNNTKAVVAVAPTKMNVLYLGVDNPVSIAVSGYQSDELSIEVVNGRFVGGNGEYILRPVRPGELIVNVFARGEKVSEAHFRVKTVPDPMAMVNGQVGGNIDHGLFSAQIGVTAEMRNFDFDLQFTIVEFTLATLINGNLKEFKSESNRFTDEQKKVIKDLRPGDMVYIQDIKAVGPDGSTRPLNTIYFKLE